MSAGWATLLVAVTVYAVLVTVWNVALMRLLDIAKHDVRRLSSDRAPVAQAVSVMENVRTRPTRLSRPRPAPVVEQRVPDGVS